MRIESHEVTPEEPGSPLPKSKPKPKAKVQRIGRVSVYERSNGFWVLRWRDASGEWRNAQRREKEDALKYAREIRDSLDLRKVRISDSERELILLARQLRDPEAILREAIHRQQQSRGITVADLCDRVVKHYYSLAESQTGGIITARDQDSRLSAIATRLGDRFLTSLTGEDVLEFLRGMSSVGARTRLNQLNTLRNSIRLARAWDLVPGNFDPTEPARINARNFPELLRLKREDPCIWTRDDFDAGLKALHLPSHRAFFILCGTLGLRPHEAQGVVAERDGLRWSCIDWEHRTITIARDQTKTRRGRVMSFAPFWPSGWTEEIADAAWNHFCTLMEPLRPADDNEPMTIRSAQSSVSPLVRAATGKPWPKDGLRHTWISALAGLGVHKDYVAKLAGNSISDIDRYYENPMNRATAARWFARP